MGLDVDIDVALTAGRHGLPSRASFRRWVEAAAGACGIEQGEVAIRVVDLAEGAELNRQWRGREGATNVLSFPAGDMPEVPGLVPHLGDLVLCAPVVRDEARAQRKPVTGHWAHLVVHGTLHLFGHDHAHPAEAECMEALEVRLLGGLGIADPYQPRPASAAARRLPNHE